MQFKWKILLLSIVFIMFISFSFGIDPNESFDCVSKCRAETQKLLPECERICGGRLLVSGEIKVCLDNCVKEGKTQMVCQKECGLETRVLNADQICLDNCIKEGKTQPICQKQCAILGNEKSVRFSWESFWSMIGVLAMLILAFIGWYFHKRKRKKAIMLLEMVDMTYEKYKFQQDMCSLELTKLKKTLEDEFKKGNIDENNFDFILGKIDRYNKEFR